MTRLTQQTTERTHMHEIKCCTLQHAARGDQPLCPLPSLRNATIAEPCLYNRNSSKMARVSMAGDDDKDLVPFIIIAEYLL